MNQQFIHYKVYLTGVGNEPEIRRMVVDKIISYNYFFLSKKILATFPVLKDVPFTIYWRDKEGDNVKICTDDELMIALQEMESDVFKKLYVFASRQQGSVQQLHRGVICDGCDNAVQGFRYKCLICSDYELCSNCEQTQVHSDHPMIRIPKPIARDMPFGKRFAKEMPKMTKNLECLIQQQATVNSDIAVASTSKSTNDEPAQKDKKELIKFCSIYSHNLIANLLYEKMRLLNMNKNGCSSSQQKSLQEPHPPEPTVSSATSNDCTNDEQQEVADLSNEFNSLTIDERGNDNAQRESLEIVDTCVEEEEERHEEPTVSAAASTSSSEVEANADTTSANDESLIFQMDSSVPADPTPVLQAQPTLPSVPASPNVTPTPATGGGCQSPSHPRHFLTPVPLSRLLADPNDPNEVENRRGFSAFVLPPSPRDDYRLDNSWAVLDGKDDEYAYQRRHPVACLPTIDTTPRTPYDTERLYPRLAVPQFTPNLTPVEETMMRLQLLGFEDTEWLRQIVESKKGNIKEVLRFLTPITKKPSTNLQ